VNTSPEPNSIIESLVQEIEEMIIGVNRKIINLNFIGEDLLNNFIKTLLLIVPIIFSALIIP
jgi:hypothetical protein